MFSNSLGVMSSKERRRGSPEIGNLVELRIEGQVSLRGHPGVNRQGELLKAKEKSRKGMGVWELWLGAGRALQRE